MKVGIHVDPGEKFPVRLERYEKILDHNHIDHIRLSVNDPDFWEKVRDLDLFIYRFRTKHDYLQLASAILPIIENELKIKCFPNRHSSWQYDDKIKQYYLAKVHDLPMVESFIFWDRKKAESWAIQAQYPVIFKLRGGAASVNVVFIKNKHQALKYIRRMFGRGMHSGTFSGIGTLRNGFSNLKSRLKFEAVKINRRLKHIDPDPYYQKHKNYVYFQKFLPGNSFDTRITVIGDRAFGYRRYTRKNDFRSSGSGLLDNDQAGVAKDMIRMAFDISKKMGYESMAYDFLRDEDGKPWFCEMSYTYVDEFIYQLPGYWDSDLNFREGHFWPQYLHLKDALGTDLIQPENL